jgi:hypothetical protein
MAEGEPDDLEKIARLAIQRRYWDEKTATFALGQARAAAPNLQKQTLKRAIERVAGLTYDELARLEKEALAPPVSQTPSKPLPRLGSAKPASEVNESLASTDVVIPRKESAPLPPPPQAETYTPPPREAEIITSAKKLPSLTEKSDKAEKTPPSDTGLIAGTPKPLPRLNAPKKKTDAIKREEPPPP